MSEIFGYAQVMTVEDIKRHPEKLVDIVLASKDRSIVLERRADIVHISYLKACSAMAKRLVAEAREEYLAKQQTGYTRDQAILDILEAQKELTTQLIKPSAE